MNTFMNENFLLHSDLAKDLFAKSMEQPIIDYHCHLSPKEIWEDKPYDNITQIWLYGDHYKWRLMRSCGIDEEYITGNKSDLEKFKAYAKTLELSIGNPVYSFSHLELQRYFDVYDALNENNAEEIFNRCNKVIKEKQLSPRKLIAASNVETLCTTDDPADSLEYHILIKNENTFDTTVLPAFRPDKAMNIFDNTYKEYITNLAEVSEVEIKDFPSLIEAIEKRIEFFNSLGCKTSDHALVSVPYNKVSEEELNKIFTKAINNEELTSEEIDEFQTAFILKMAAFDNKYNWVMQLHFGCIRNNNSLMFNKLGPDTGFDAVNTNGVNNLGKLLDDASVNNNLPKTVLYSLNPIENTQIVTLMGCFQGGIRGKMQHGSAWWFNDHKDGIISQMKSLANDGVLGNFIGMLTDSRSFLSYPRHEYFRRLMCDLIAEYVNEGEYPNDKESLYKLVKNIAHDNAKEYFNF